MEKQHRIKQKYMDMILALLAVSIMPLFLYGTRILPLIGAALATAVIVEGICIRVAGKKVLQTFDFSCIITALVTALLLPATAPIWIAVVAVSIGLMIAKHPFGGTGNNIFNPAAVGLAFVAICWPEYVLRFPIPFATKGIVDDTLIQYTNSSASILKLGGTPPIGYIDVLLGKFAGPMGATCMLVIFSCLLYLVARKVISLRVVLSAGLMVALFALVFQRVSTGPLNSLVYEFSAGALFFGLVFMSNDPTSIPKTKAGQILFGVILGTIVMIFRHFGAIDFEFVYAILLANIFAIPCDHYALRIHKKLTHIVDTQGNNKQETTLVEHNSNIEAVETSNKKAEKTDNHKFLLVSEDSGNNATNQDEKTIQKIKSTENKPKKKPASKKPNKKKSNRSK